MTDYRKYVSDEQFMSGYTAYQERYAENARESDKELIRHVLRLRASMPATSRTYRLLDVGCSTGNLLYHIRRAAPDLELEGGDMVESQLEQCRRDSRLTGITFRHLDLLAMMDTNRFDLVILNAVVYLFDDELFARALINIHRSLRPGGSVLFFDWVSPFPQDLVIKETSASHPDGLILHCRSTDRFRRLLDQAGFTELEFHPFRIPIDLPVNNDPSLITYTRSTLDGERLLFRGTLHQPWHHIIARKPL
jgi:SAM-dependent methyltransferase